MAIPPHAPGSNGPGLRPRVGIVFQSPAANPGSWMVAPTRVIYYTADLGEALAQFLARNPDCRVLKVERLDLAHRVPAAW